VLGACNNPDGALEAFNPRQADMGAADQDSRPGSFSRLVGRWASGCSYEHAHEPKADLVVHSLRPAHSLLNLFGTNARQARCMPASPGPCRPTACTRSSRSRTHLGKAGGQRELLLLRACRELLDGRPQVLVLGANAPPARHRHHHVVQAPALRSAPSLSRPSRQPSPRCSTHLRAAPAWRAAKLAHLKRVDGWARPGVVEILWRLQDRVTQAPVA